MVGDGDGVRDGVTWMVGVGVLVSVGEIARVGGATVSTVVGVEVGISGWDVGVALGRHEAVWVK